MNTPDFLPVLSAGAHASPEEGACVMEYVSLLAGESWSDSPACTHPVLARMAQVVNDRLSDSERHRLIPLIGRLFGTAESGTDHERRVLSVRLACWSARQVLDRAADRDVAPSAIETAEAWCEGRASASECRAAAAAYAPFAAAAANAAYAAYAANAYAAYAYAAYAANAAANAYAAANADLVPLLAGLVDEYDRLTGRTEVREVTDDDLRNLAAATTTRRPAPTATR